MDDYDAIVNSGPKWYHNTYSMPETIVPKTDQSLILGSDADVAGFRRFMSNGKLKKPLSALGSESPFKIKTGSDFDMDGKTLMQRLIDMRARSRMSDIGNYKADKIMDMGLKGTVEHVNDIDPEVMQIFENTVIPRLDEKFLRENGGVEGIKNILREGGYNVADEAAWNQLYGATDAANSSGMNFDLNNGIAVRGWENL
jgi:hypothetical protein